MEMTELEYELKLQKENLNVLQECLKNINVAIQNTDNISNSNEVTELLKDVKNSLEYSRNTITNLEKLKTLINTGATFSNEFNVLSESCSNLMHISSLKLNEFLLKYIKNTSFFVDGIKTETRIEADPLDYNTPIYNNSNQSKSNPSSNVIVDKITGSTFHDNNVLLISEKKNKVFLPYTVKDLNRIVEKNKSHRNIQEIIDKKFTISLNKYKSPIISRFRETYNLMKKREKATLADSLDMALEVAFNSKLNPAVITACRNFEQLEAYLDCLELNELSKFDYFEIKYEFSLAKK